MKDLNTIIHGNCLDVLRTLADASVDGIVTDPPYELGFMGKKWDSSGIAYKVEMWSQCLRVLKPGGYLLAFSSARTYHRMAVAIEDAGFEIRDMVEWIYSSGFPKSQNLGKAYDQRMGNEREVVGKKIDLSTGRPMSAKQAKAGNGKNINEGWDRPWRADDKHCEDMTLLTKGTSEYEGLGSSLKPAHEPICMARKPLSEPTILDNVVKHGVGGLSIDDCRIPTEDNRDRVGGIMQSQTIGQIDGKERNFVGSSLGRFPANVIVTDDALNDGTVTKSGSKLDHHKVGTDENGKRLGSVYGKYNAIRNVSIGDSGSKSRYFDIDVWAEKNGIIQDPKASKSERNRGCEKLATEKKGLNFGEELAGNGQPINIGNNKNHHPTVKPISVMSWLVRLISRPGDVILDPFTGSGSTPVACILNGRQYIGIELTDEYLPIIEARIKQAEEDAKFILNGKKPVKESRLYNDIKTGLNPFRHDKEQESLF